MGALKFEITGTCESLKNALRDAQTAFHTTADAAEQQGQRIDALLGKLKETAAMIGVGFGVKEFGRKVMEVRGQFQQLEMAFTTMLQSESKANDLMNQLVRTAATTPFDLQGVAEGAKQLLAYGTSAEEVNGTLVRLGDIAAGLSIPLNDLVWLYGTTMTQGRMFTQDLRQFQGRGIPIAEEIAKIKGVAVDAVGELVTAGKVTSDVVKQAIENMTEEGSKFGGLMEAQSHAVTGEIRNIEDSIDTMFNSIGQKSEGIINTTLSGVSYVIGHWEQVGKVILTVATAFGTYKAVLLAVIAAQKIAAMAKTAEAFISLAKGITTAKDAMLLFNIATNANPLGLILGIIASAAATFALFGDSTDEATEKQEKFGESADKAAEKAESLFAILQSASSTSKVHKDALNELKGIADEYGITLSKEGDLTQQLIEKKEALIGVIREEAIERQRANDITDASDAYQKNIQDLKDKIKDSLSDDFSDMQKNQLVNLISEEDIKKITEAYKAMINAQKKSVELTGSWNSRFSTEQIGTYNKTISDLAEKVGVYSKALGVSERSANAAKRAIQNNGMALATTRKEYDDTINATNKAAAAAQSAEMATDGLTESQRSLSDKTRMAKENVNDLANEIKKMIETYNNSNINIKISYEELNTPPTWMQGVAQKMSSDQLKNLASMHQSRANRMRSHKAQTGRALVMKNQQGYYTNEREEQVMAGQYAILAQQKKTEEENARRGAEEAKKKKTKSTTKKDDRKQLEQQQKDYAALLKKNEQERKREAEDLAFSTTEAEIAAMKDGTDKTIAQINLDFKKKEAEINRSYEDLKQQKIDKAKELWKANPKNKDKVFDDKAVDTSYSKAETDNYNAQLKANQEEHDRALAEEFAKEHQALNDYLKEYGDYQQKKLAIQQEYAEKIAKAQTQGEKMSLQAALDKSLSDLSTSELKASIDWEGVFNDLDSVSLEYLQKLKKQLQGMLSAKDITAENAQVLAAQINKIDAQITSKKSEWKSAFGLVIPELEKIRQLEKEAADAQDEVVRATKEYNDSLKEVEQTRQSIVDLLSQNGIQAKTSDITSQNSQGYIDQFSSARKDTKELTDLFSKLGEKERGLTKNTQTLNTATTKAGQAAAKAGGSFASTVAIIDEVIQKVNKNVQSAVGLVDELGMADTKFGQGLSSFAQSSQYATEAWNSLKSGDFAGTAKGVLGSLRTLGDALGDWGISGFGSSDTSLAKDIERLTSSNENLQKSIDVLSDKMEKATSMSEITQTYEQQKKYLEQSIKNTQEMMSREGKVYSNGFLGIGGSKSSNHKINKAVSSSEWDRVSSIVGHSVKSASDFWNLTSEEMANVAAYAGDIYDKIKQHADDGKGNAAQYMDTYISYYKQLEELENTQREKMTNISFDNVKSEFSDLLSDMNSETEDFTNNFEEMMRNAIVNSLMVSKYNKMLEDWYKAFSKAMEDDTITETEKNNLKSQYDSIVADAKSERDALMKTLELDTTSKSQSATSGGWQSMGQETADELNGRFTALQIAGEQAKVNTDLIVSAVNTLVVKTDANFTTLSEVRNMMIITNSYLEDIRKYNKLTYEEFGSKLDDIKRSLKNL
nr:MAG TPA: Tape measure domain protein [Caudoviricetes sp.]